jgi:hypothetical protein
MSKFSLKVQVKNYHGKFYKAIKFNILHKNNYYHHKTWSMQLGNWQPHQSHHLDNMRSLFSIKALELRLPLLSLPLNEICFQEKIAP